MRSFRKIFTALCASAMSAVICVSAVMPVCAETEQTALEKELTVSQSPKIKQISLGYDFAAAVTEDGGLYTWGSNAYGQLADGTNENRYTPKRVMENVKMVSCGSSFGVSKKSYILIVTNDGKLYASGSNDLGQLGIGDKSITEVNTPTLAYKYGNVVSVSAGENHNAILRTDGIVLGWGNGDFGMNGNAENIFGGYYMEYTTSSPCQVLGLSDIVYIDMGYQHSLAIDSKGSLYMWGKNDYGQLAQGYNGALIYYTPTKVSGIPNVKSADAGFYFTAAVTNDNKLYAWGRRDSNQFSGSSSSYSLPHLIDEKFTDVQICGKHGIAIGVSGTVYTWGSNNFGECANTATLTAKTGLGENIVSVAASYYNSAAVSADGEAWIWGYNGFGVLGIGTESSGRHSTPEKVELPSETYILGDMDGSGNISDADIKKMAELLSGPEQKFNKYGDVNGDGQFDIRDLSALIYKINENKK